MAVKKNKSSGFQFAILFIIILAIGINLGIYGTKKYLENKHSAKDDYTVYPEAEAKDITNDSAYADAISKMHGFVKDNSLFYSSTGINVETMDNGTKLTLAYESIIANKEYTSGTLSVHDNNYCDYNFVVDPTPADSSIPTLICTIKNISRDSIVKASKSLFDDETINTNANFNPSSNVSCVVVNNNYVCGNLTNTVIDTGSLQPKFDIIKVTLDTDGTIIIYDKGYLVDKRKGVDNPNDEYDNYYLHSADSTSYYYELKSADNLTFKHTFKTNNNVNYYYVGTEVYKG